MKKNVRLSIPRQMQLLCNMFEIQPAALLQCFAEDLSLVLKDPDQEDRRKIATDYLARCSMDDEQYRQHQQDNFYDELNLLLERNPDDQAYLESFANKWPCVWKRLRKQSKGGSGTLS